MNGVRTDSIELGKDFFSSGLIHDDMPIPPVDGAENFGWDNKIFKPESRYGLLDERWAKVPPIPFAGHTCATYFEAGIHDG